MWGKGKESTIPYGWRTYRQNLLLLYEDVGGKGTDVGIDALIEKTAYQEANPRPGHEDQWMDLNALELRLFRLLENTCLMAEMERKFVQAEQSGLTGVLALRNSYLEIRGDTAVAVAERRPRAIAFLEEMFVKYSYRHAERRKRREVSFRLGYLGVAILGLPLLIGLAYAFTALVLVLVNQIMSPTPPNGAEPAKEFLEAFKVWLAGLATGSSLPFFNLFVVMYSGIVGAFFSRLSSYVGKMENLRWSEMDILYSFPALSMRLLVGAVAASILYFLAMGNFSFGVVIEQENFVPWVLKEDKSGPMIPLRPSEDFARLIVWSVVAGFFERFVPDRLAKASQEGTDGKKQAASSESQSASGDTSRNVKL